MERVYKREGILFKILPCLLIAMYAVMCLFGSYVCATDVSFTYNDDEITITDINNPCDGLAIFRNTNYSIGVSSPRYFYVSWDTSTTTLYMNPSDNNHIVSNDYITFYFSYDKINFKSADYYSQGGHMEFLYTNADIYDYNNPDEVLFQSPTQKVGGIVATQVQGTQMDKTLQEITGLLPVVLVVIVGLIAIRKGILFLMRILRHQ